MDDLVLGIDTGGTYTDAVLLNHRTREVVATAKALTTHYDLKIGILAAVDALDIADPLAIRLVSISTTLATNAIAEGKGKPIALFLIGYDPDLIAAFGFGSRLATPRYFFIRGGHDLNGMEQAPLDVEALERYLAGVRDGAEAVAISSYFSPLNPTHEEQAGEFVANSTGLPVVLGHQLSSQLDSIRRATTASLNASLLPVLREFIQAVSIAMRERGVRGTLMIMRGDGTLMNAPIANRRPVETVHSGPAASAVGGHFLAGVDRGLVIDVGGTTTDIAVVDGGQVRVNEAGAVVGGYRTAVRAADIRSIGLGGDSHITFDRENQLAIGPQRVVPLSYLASQHPQVRQEVLALRYAKLTEGILSQLEYWFLQRTPNNLGALARNATVLRALEILHQGPQPLGRLLERLGLMHPVQFAGQELLHREVIGRAGLTPTDLLHITGEYAPWDVEVATTAAGRVALLRGWSLKELIERVKAGIAERIVEEVVTFLSGRSVPPRTPITAASDLGRWFYDNSLHPNHPYLETRIHLKLPIIGIGAPAGIFLPRVAELLETNLILPEHYAVANAIGAVAASVVATEEARVYPVIRRLNVVGYYAQVGDHRKMFDSLQEALDYAGKRASGLALVTAQEAGAVDPQATLEQLPDGPDSFRLVARAVGTPRLGNS
ncbi:MAG TPA: hydantoinase/oxoprolinase family protein [Anaerolineae bacterium]|nr:hydantoinase/oxoprolinase family protein [Anaerolineae bacterium]